MSNPDGPTVTIHLSERDENQVTLKPVGLVPYILITVDDVTEETSGPEAALTIGVEVGGGTPIEPREDLATFLEFVVESLRDGVLAVAEDAS